MPKASSGRSTAAKSGSAKKSGNGSVKPRTAPKASTRPGTSRKSSSRPGSSRPRKSATRRTSALTLAGPARGARQDEYGGLLGGLIR
ncbi:MAG TPA: hypothetical protein VGG25_02345 [Streptosporangiaceae bacterium]|jgi:hypothetical protein